MLKVDFYKPHHQDMYPDNMTKLYTNGTCRKSRFPYITDVVVWGIQHFVLEYFIEDFNKNFFIFTKDERIAAKTGLDSSALKGFDSALAVHKKSVIDEYKRHVPINTKRIEALWDLGYLPIELKALDEGTLCPIGVPMLTITNTHPEFAWLVNYLETLISCSLWQSFTSATLALQFRKLLNKYALQTTNSVDFVQWQAHDFSMRGMSSVESAIMSGMAHLAVGFTGTDVIPAIYQLETSYDATGLIGASVPATEHSVMCMGTKEAEVETFRRLLELYPADILSVVSDTWNLWDVVKPGGLCAQLKNEIMARNGKLVIRPDSGDPVDILCGTVPHLSTKTYEDGREVIHKGLIECLWDLFGGTEVKGADGKMYKVLDSHIGAIYGDAIERAGQICERLAAKGFASTNVVLGVGSFTYQYNTRDTFGFAMKATYGELLKEKTTSYGNPGTKVPVRVTVGREIFKDPITDDGTKKSKKGLLVVGQEADGTIKAFDQCSWDEEAQGLLTTVFKDGVLVKRTTLDEVRERINKTL